MHAWIVKKKLGQIMKTSLGKISEIIITEYCILQHLFFATKSPNPSYIGVQQERAKLKKKVISFDHTHPIK